MYLPFARSPCFCGSAAGASSTEAGMIARIRPEPSGQTSAGSGSGSAPDWSFQPAQPAAHGSTGPIGWCATPACTACTACSIAHITGLSSRPPSSPVRILCVRFGRSADTGSIFALVCGPCADAPTALMVFVAHMIARTAMGHSGSEVFPAHRNTKPLFGWVATVNHHNMHHAHAKYTLGLYFT